jgi:hypothetical protein
MLQEHSFLYFCARLSRLRIERGACEQLHLLSKRTISKVRTEIAFIGYWSAIGSLFPYRTFNFLMLQCIVIVILLVKFLSNIHSIIRIAT